MFLENKTLAVMIYFLILIWESCTLLSHDIIPPSWTYFLENTMEPKPGGCNSFQLLIESRIRNFILLSMYVVFQDSYAIRSFERGISAQNAGHFAWEIVPVWLWFLPISKCSQCMQWCWFDFQLILFATQVEVSRGRGKPTLVDKDEGLGKVNRFTNVLTNLNGPSSL